MTKNEIMLNHDFLYDDFFLFYSQCWDKKNNRKTRVKKLQYKKKKKVTPSNERARGVLDELCSEKRFRFFPFTVMQSLRPTCSLR